MSLRGFSIPRFTTFRLSFLGSWTTSQRPYRGNTGIKKSSRNVRDEGWRGWGKEDGIGLGTDSILFFHSRKLIYISVLLL